ncbi:MAG: cadherin-like beta sandwich domain-containing protein, partial [Acutalibacter sp.]
MKALRFTLSLLCWTLLFSLWGAAAQAAGFAPALTVEEGRPGGVVEVAFPYDGSLGEVAAFRAQVEYDPTVLEYLRPTYGESVQAGTVTTQNTPGKVASVYTAPAGGPYLAAEDAIIYRFRILESAVPGLATVFASAFELSTPEPAAIPEDVDVSLSFQVLEPPSSDARLLSLAPDHGQLQPAFDPDVFAYTMTVPYEVEAITFTAEPVPGAACRVNRKNLGSGGSDTLFRITVTAEDGETKSEYQVTVHRQEKEEEEKPELSADASLLSLTPATGTLTPAFDPDVYEYSLTVPFEVTTMTFTAEAPEGATYRVSRKNLGAGGSDTDFEITVTAADGETRQVYTVTVHRSEKEEEEKPE